VVAGIAVGGAGEPVGPDVGADADCVDVGDDEEGVGEAELVGFGETGDVGEAGGVGVAGTLAEAVGVPLGDGVGPGDAVGPPMPFAPVWRWVRGTHRELLSCLGWPPPSRSSAR
jgi:hypothetical protein